VASIRRVVTGHDANGRAVVIEDANASDVLQSKARPGVALTNLWTSEVMPLRYDDKGGVQSNDFIMFPSQMGTVFRISSFEPENQDTAKTLDGRQYFTETGAGEVATGSERHAFMHRTETLDYAIVLEGEIMLLLDDEDVKLKTGDVIVQRGTNHAWCNRGTTTCRIAFILIGAKGKRQ